MGNTDYGWLVTINKGGKRTLTTQPGKDALEAISSALRFNPEISVTDILEMRREDEL
jgi:hypothetical protein